MQRFVRILRKIFCPPPLPTVIIAAIGYAFIIIVAACEIEIPAIQYAAYLASAYALIITITCFPKFIALAKKAKQRAANSAPISKLRGTKLGGRFFDDVRFRTKLFLYGGLFINVIYIGINLFSGIYYRSVWFISLAAYYVLLAAMRFILLRKGKGAMTMETELRRYRMCGVMLLMMNQALAGIVILIIYRNEGFDYPGLLIYAMAVYSFCSIIAAVVNLVKFRKHGSPLLSAAKVINVVAAMVSILSLETAMLAQFGGDDDPFFRKAMTGATGGGVCVIVIGMAIFMIWRATKRIKELKIYNSET